MSGSATLWFRQELLKIYFSRDSYTPQYTGLALCMCTKPPVLNAPVSMLNEPVGAGYSRVPISLTGGNWTLSGFGEVANTYQVAFGPATGVWGVLGGWALVTSGGSDAEVAVVGSLARPQRILTGDAPVLPPMACSIGLYD